MLCPAQHHVPVQVSKTTSAHNVENSTTSTEKSICNERNCRKMLHLRLRLTLRLLVMLRVSCSCRLRALIPRSDDVTPVVDDGCWSSCCSKLSTDWPSAFRRAVSAAHSARLWLSFERRLTFSSSKSCHNSETTT